MENLLLKHTLIAIQDEINQYHEGNLTVEMVIDNIRGLVEHLQDNN